MPAANLPLLPWPAEAIWEAVYPHLPGFTVEVLPEVDSTNSELMRRARAGQCEPIVLVAQTQTAGRGQRGRAWHSGDPTAPGASLTFSLGLPLAPAAWDGLSLAVGLAVVQGLQAALAAAARDSDGGSGVAAALQQPAATATAATVKRPPAPSRLGLKWPNDVWLDASRKLGGLLVETASVPVHAAAPSAPSAQPIARYVVVGVGLNVAPCPAMEVDTPPACLQELDAAINAPAVLLHVVPRLVAVVQAFERNGFAPLHQQYAAWDVLQNRQVLLQRQIGDNDAALPETGTALGVNHQGALQVLTPGGLRVIAAGDVRVRPV